MQLPQEIIVGEENNELSLKLQLQCGEETVPFINPYPTRGSRFTCSTLCETATTAYHNGNKPLSGYMLFYLYSCLNLLNLRKIFWAEMVLLFNSYRPRYGTYSSRRKVGIRGFFWEFNSCELCICKGEISDMDAVSCRGGRDESEDIIRPGTPREKLCLSKYQSSILEESFREHFTLSPVLFKSLASQFSTSFLHHVC
jgi:hypothetical protein